MTMTMTMRALMMNALFIHQDVLGVVVGIVVGPEGQTVDGFGSRNIPEHRTNIETKKKSHIF